MIAVCIEKISITLELGKDQWRNVHETNSSCVLYLLVVCALPLDSHAIPEFGMAVSTLEAAIVASLEYDRSSGSCDPLPSVGCGDTTNRYRRFRPYESHVNNTTNPIQQQFR